VKRYRIKPGTKVALSNRDPDDDGAFDGDRDERDAETSKLNARLEELQELLYAQKRHKLLVVLQAMDTGGKDGTIRHVFDGTNPQGVKVAAFKRPTEEELAHDFLWRVHHHAPAAGEIAIFNRSHYEDVLVPHACKTDVPGKVWKQRYDHINAFERMLADEGTTIVKFFLHISRAEQKKRLQSRLDEPHKRWKFARSDLDTRKLWPRFTAAYEAVLSTTSTKWAPWYVVPANSKSYRNYVVSRILVDTLAALDMKYPEPEEDLDGIEIH
jgi:PPK2 family polyphosphate:nucleotide phosphotransferase